MDDLLKRLAEAEALGLTLCGEARQAIVAMHRKMQEDEARHSESRADALALAYARLYRLVEPLLADVRMAMSEDGEEADLRDAERAASDILESAPPERLGAALLVDALAAPDLRAALASRHLALLEKTGLDTDGLAALGIAADLAVGGGDHDFMTANERRVLPFDQTLKLTLHGHGVGAAALQAFFDKLAASQRTAA